MSYKLDIIHVFHNIFFTQQFLMKKTFQPKNVDLYIVILKNSDYWVIWIYHSLNNHSFFLINHSFNYILQIPTFFKNFYLVQNIF